MGDAGEGRRGLHHSLIIQVEDFGSGLTDERRFVILAYKDVRIKEDLKLKLKTNRKFFMVSAVGVAVLVLNAGVLTADEGSFPNLRCEGKRPQSAFDVEILLTQRGEFEAREGVHPHLITIAKGKTKQWSLSSRKEIQVFEFLNERPHDLDDEFPRTFGWLKLNRDALEGEYVEIFMLLPNDFTPDGELWQTRTSVKCSL